MSDIATMHHLLPPCQKHAYYYGYRCVNQLNGINRIQIVCPIANSTRTDEKRMTNGPRRLAAGEH
jgi:hypothetical protein